MGQRHLHAQFLVQEVLYLVAQLHGRVLVQLLEIGENLISQLQGATHEHLFVFGRNGKELLVGHIVNILDAYQFVRHLIEVVDEGAVTGGTEQERAVFLAERLVVRRYGNGIRGLILEGEGDIVLYTVLLLISLFNGTDGNLKEGLVLRRNGDGEVAGVVLISHILLGFHQMLCNGGAHFFRIAMEVQHALGLAAICQAFFLEKLFQGFQPIFTAVFGGAEELGGVEGEVLDAGGQLGAGGIGR